METIYNFKFGNLSFGRLLKLFYCAFSASPNFGLLKTTLNKAKSQNNFRVCRPVGAANPEIVLGMRNAAVDIENVGIRSLQGKLRYYAQILGSKKA